MKLTKFIPLREDDHTIPHEENFYDLNPDLQIGPKFETGVDEYCIECGEPMDPPDIDESGNLVCPHCGFVEEDDVERWLRSRTGTNYIREAIRMARELTKFISIDEQVSPNYKMVSGKNQTTPQGNGSVATPLKKQGSPSDPASSPGGLPKGGKLSGKFTNHSELSTYNSKEPITESTKLEETTHDDFVANYGVEIKRAIKNLKSIGKILNALPEDSPFFAKWEQDPHDPLKLADQVIAQAIESWAGSANDVSVGEIARAAVANQTRNGTEPQQVLFTIEDLLKYLERNTKGLEKAVVHESVEVLNEKESPESHGPGEDPEKLADARAYAYAKLVDDFGLNDDEAFEAVASADVGPSRDLDDMIDAIVWDVVVNDISPSDFSESQKTLTTFKPLNEDGAAGRTTEYATESKEIGKDSKTPLPKGGELSSEFNNGEKISRGQEMMPESGKFTKFTPLK